MLPITQHKKRGNGEYHLPVQALGTGAMVNGSKNVQDARAASSESLYVGTIVGVCRDSAVPGQVLPVADQAKGHG